MQNHYYFKINERHGVVSKAAFYLPSPGPINAPQASANFPPPPFTASASAYIFGISASDGTGLDWANVLYIYLLASLPHTCKLAITMQFLKFVESLYKTCPRGQRRDHATYKEEPPL